MIYLIAFIIGVPLGIYIQRVSDKHKQSRKMQYFQTSDTPIGDMLADEMGITL